MRIGPECPNPQYQIDDAEGDYRGTVATHAAAQDVIGRAWDELGEVWEAFGACACPDGTGCHLIPWEAVR